MPRGSIPRLYFVEAPSWRIAIIVMLTLVFAICARFLADGKRLAVFAACAAYAAVLVVFVSENYTLAERAFSFRVHQRSASTVPKFQGRNLTSIKLLVVSTLIIAALGITTVVNCFTNCNAYLNMIMNCTLLLIWTVGFASLAW